MLLILLWRFGRRPMALIIMVMAGLSLMLSELGWRNFPITNFYLLPSRAWEILAGALCAFYLFNKPAIPNQKWSSILALMGMMAIIFAVILFDKKTPFPSLYALVPVGGTLLIILYARSDNIVGRMPSISQRKMSDRFP